MAKINRFYLLIAAFICTHSYDASAAEVDCSNIKNLSEAQQCYKDWNRNFTYEGWKAELELHPNIEGINFCGSWNGDIDEDTGEHYLHNTCIEVIPEELANYCCNLKSNGGTSCEYVVLGWDTCESTDTGGDSGGDPEYPLGACDDEYAQGVLAEISGALENVDNFVNSLPTQDDFDGMGIKACEEWSDPDEYGVEHCTIVTGSVVAEYECGHITQAYYDYCMRMYHGEILCSGNMPCDEGQYKSGTECLLCEAMRWIDKDKNEHDIKNVKPATTTGADSQADCYIPANTTGLEDATGYFSYTGNCPYYGS